MDHIIETSYPISFRNEDSKILGNYLKNRNNVVLVGMKRVGIGSFLKFFIHHKNTSEKFINDNKKHIFIPIDLNDLVERELFPFWVLTLKRIEDAILSSKIDNKTKKYIEDLFVDSIQSQDLFLTIDSIRKSLVRLVEAGYLPTLFFIRFDRLESVVTPDFFSNLQGLSEATHKNLSFVFTSVRSLESLSPQVFTRASVSAFVRTMYLKPMQKKDSELVLEKNLQRHSIKFDKNFTNEILSLTDGYTQFINYAVLNVMDEKGKKDLDARLLNDERIGLQSDEIWESLKTHEQTVLTKVIEGKKLKENDRNEASYLWNTGILSNSNKVFSPLFESYVKDLKKKSVVQKELSKKEHMLLSLLEENRGALCEREFIIQSVWPEVEDFGVSDWAVDRLVARLRQKLKERKSSYEIITVKTRGYKLA